MTPFFFGPSERRLFGVYDPARNVRGSDRRGVVICYPWGSEYIYAHRSLRQLAIRLSRSGIETLRFDYYGTGDSSGEMIDTDLAGWKHDIEIAIDELSELIGTKHIALLGLRLGANLAASVTAKRADKGNPLLLWDPIVSGKTYLRELKHDLRDGRPTALAAVARREEVGGGYEIDGFPLTNVMASELEKLDLTTELGDTSANPFIIVSSERSQPDASLQNAAEQKQLGSSVAVEFVEDTLAWVERPQNIGTIPVKVISRIVDWMSEWR